MTRRCDNCTQEIDGPDAYRLARFQGRLPIVCGPCLEKIARGNGQADRATRRPAA